MSEKLEKEPLLSYKNGKKQGNKKQKSLDDNAILELVGLRWSMWRAFLFYTSSFLTGGILLLVSFWFPKFYAYGRKCDTRLRTATFAFIKGADKEWEEVKITDLKTDANVDRICDGVYSCFVENGTMRVFDFRNLRFAYDFKKDTFRRPDFDLSIPFIEIKKRYSNGIRDKDHYEFFMQLFGPNEIELPIPTILEMIFDEIFHPFYIFQMLSIALWYAEGYIYYPIAILFISTISLVWTLYSTRKNLVNLRELAKSECDISLFRYGDSEPITLNSRDVAPGDIVEIKDEMLLPCDLVIISGECVMNESMLTGESNPVLKYTIPSIGDIYNSHTHKKFTLFCGTKVMQVKPTSGSKHVLGLVAHTGFHTAKGALFYSILFPKPIKFKFYSDSYKFLFVMILVAIASFAWTLYHLLKISYSLSDIVFNALDLITIAVPPALPLILTIGIEFSVQRLTKKEIFCTAPSRVNYAGKIDMMCFDKTGTITEDDLALHRVQSASEKGFEDPMEDVRLMKKGPLLNTMVAAHAISKVNGNYMGHPVDVRMFESTKWDLKDADASEKYALQTVVNADSSEKLHILRRFEFEPSLQRMSVIVKETDGRIMLCTKGSPEALKALSNQKTIPYNFEAHLREFAKQGVYVIGCAYRYLDIEDSAVNALKRDALEENLTFCGLLIFSNKLKSDSVSTIYQLKKANIDVRMITGDNIHTAIAVGRQTDIIDPNKNVYIGDVDENGLKWTELDDPEHSVDMQELFKESDSFELALTGKALKLLFVGKKVEVIEHAKIFARTSPDQKAQITEHFVERGRFVGMCGDGTNDCGALKVAHIGLALSDAEASVVAPFTSKKKVIGDVVTLIAEGRCALHTSFVAFKYMMMYPLIQLMSALILLNSYSILGDFQYLYTDIWLTLPLAIFMTWTEPPNKLSSRRPTSSLFNPRIMLSLALQILFNVGAIIGINVYLHYQPWFIPNIIGKHDHTIESTIQCEENFTTFLFANFPYIISAVALNNNTPFRRPFWTNPLFLITILVTWTTSSLLVLLPQASKLTELQITPTHEFPFFWRWEIWIAAWITLVAAYGAESLLVEGPITRAISKKFKQRRLRKERERKMNARINLVIQ